MLDCTYRVHIPHHAGQLARVAQAIADGEGLIGDVVTVSLGRESSVRDITVEVRDIAQSDRIADLVEALGDVTVLWHQDRALLRHVGGKLKIDALRQVRTVRRCATCTRPGSPACARRSPHSPSSPRATR